MFKFKFKYFKYLKSGIEPEKNNIGQRRKRRTHQANGTITHMVKNINILYKSYSETALAARHLMMAQCGRNMS
jgi:hypothetical protein